MIKSVDPEKLKIVNYDKNTYVVGNPGTGKTELIILKIKHLLEQGTDPKDILCMTFTIKATEELKSRILKTFSEQYKNIGDIRVETFHSFALDSIKIYLAERNIKPNVIKEGLQRFLLYKVLKELDIFDYSDDYLITVAQNLSLKISYLKSFGEIDKYDPDEIIKKLSLIVDEKTIRKYIDKIKLFIPYIPKIISTYEKEKSKYGIDYTDMLLYFREYLKQQSIHFKYVIIDELQDANELQADIVLRLSEKGTRLVVGDRKQSIFRFQGASINTFERFKQNAKTFVLTTNYRSTNEILQYAKSYLTQITNKYDEELEYLHSESTDEPPRIIETDNYIEPTIHLVKKYLETKESIGIIARTNAQLGDVANALDELKIPYSITGSENATSEYIKDSIISLIDILINDDPSDLITVLASPFINISFKDIVEIKDKIEQDNITDINDLKKINSMKHFFGIYDSFKNNSMSMYKGFGILFNNYLLPTAITLGKDQFLTTNDIYNSIVEFFETSVLKDYNDITTYIQISSEVSEMMIGDNDSKVKLHTVHSAKGKQFDAVIYVPKKTKPSRIKFIELAFEGIILTKVDISEDYKLEEYKLDFVAFTRAKTSLTVISKKSQYYIPDASQIDETNYTLELDMSPETQLFNEYSEIVQLLKSKKYDDAIKKIEKLKHKKQFPVEWLKNYIETERKKRINYSYTTLSTYLNCPRKYLFSEILNLNIFGESTGAQSFGIDVHNTLEWIVKGEITLSDITDKNVLLAVNNAFKCEEQIKKKAHTFEVLGAEEWVTITMSDFLGKPSNKIIHGKIDKVVKMDDKILVIDYKTGSSSDPLQLHLYKYMYSKQHNIPLENIKGVFYHVFDRSIPLKDAERTFRCKRIRDSQTLDKLEEMKLTVNEMLFGDPKIFLQKNENSCRGCPFQQICMRLDYEVE